MVMIDWPTLFITILWFLGGLVFHIIKQFVNRNDNRVVENEYDSTPPDTFESSMFMEV